MGRRDKLLDPWQILGSEESLRTPWFTIRRYTCKTPVGGVVDSYYVHEAPDSVMIVCVTTEGLVVLERQYRFPLRAVSMDFPAGSIQDSDRSPEEAALRELREETGFSAERPTHVFSLAKDPSLSSGKMHVFLALEGRQTSQPSDPHELVTIELLQPEQVVRAIGTGEMSCAFCVATALRIATVLGWDLSGGF